MREREGTRLRLLWPGLKSRRRRHFRNGKGTGDDMRPASVYGIVTRDALVSYWPFLSRSLVTVPEVFVKVHSVQFPCPTWVEFVVGSLPCSERFFSGYSGFPLSQKKPGLPNSNSIWNARTRLNECFSDSWVIKLHLILQLASGN